jgi:Tfp pilus assembly protein PilP
MIAGLKKLALILFLLGAGPAEAQDKMELPSQKAKEAVDKLLRAPSAVRKSLQDLSDAAKAKLGEAAAESKSKANTETMPLSETKPDPTLPRGLSNMGRRDPFRPFTLNTRAVSRPRENLSPLEQVDLAQIKLVGIVRDEKEPKALVEIAEFGDTARGYIVRIGTSIGTGDGKIKAITRNEVIVEEFYTDIQGAKRKREVSKKLTTE